jgi:CHRD domain
MRRTLLLVTLASLMVVALIATGASAGKDADFASPLSHAQEVGVVNAPGAGGYAEFRLDGSTLTYRITVRHLTGPASMAHIHGPGDRHENAGISIWLCGTAALPGPAGTPTCRTATDGLLVEGSVAVTTDQLAMIEAKLGYTNVHTAMHPGGEVRGQVLRVGKP